MPFASGSRLSASVYVFEEGGAETVPKSGPLLPPQTRLGNLKEEEEMLVPRLSISSRKTPNNLMTVSLDPAVRGDLQGRD